MVPGSHISTNGAPSDTFTPMFVKSSPSYIPIHPTTSVSTYNQHSSMLLIDPTPSASTSTCALPPPPPVSVSNLMARQPNSVMVTPSSSPTMFPIPIDVPSVVICVVFGTVFIAMLTFAVVVFFILLRKQMRGHHYEIKERVILTDTPITVRAHVAYPDCPGANGGGNTPTMVPALFIIGDDNEQSIE